MNQEIIVPVAAFCMVLGIVAIGVSFAYSVRRLQNKERILALEKGLPVGFDTYSDPARVVTRARRTAIILTSTGVGIISCFAAISWIAHSRDPLNGAALGIIPLIIGLGLFVDYQLQRRELNRLHARAA